MLDSVKQLSFYTECFNDAPRWSEPTDAVDPKLADAILATARMLNREKATSRTTLRQATMIDALLEFQKQVFSVSIRSGPRIAECLRRLVVPTRAGGNADISIEFNRWDNVR